MRPPRTPLTAALSLAACSLLLAGCSAVGDDENPEQAPDRSSEPVNGGRVEPGESEPRETLASQDVTDNGADLHIAIHELARRGETVELTFSLTNTDSDDDWSFAGRLAGVNILHEDADTVAAVELVDPVNSKVHLVARDSEDNCVCSDASWGDILEPGDSVLMSATFGAPPEDVSTMTVRMPMAGSLNDVPIS